MPHCDTLNGPVVLACKRALETGNINYVLIWIPKESEGELKEVFEKVLKVRDLSQESKDLADYYFFETAVRLHRAGEGEGFTGLKEEGEHDPIVEKAEKAIETEDEEEFIEDMEVEVVKTLEERFQNCLKHKNFDINDLEEGRKYIKSYIEFVVFAHHLYESLGKNHDLDSKSHHEH